MKRVVQHRGALIATSSIVSAATRCQSVTPPTHIANASNNAGTSSSSWRQPVIDRTTLEEMGLSSDKTVASGAILSEKEYDESKRALGGGLGKGGSASTSSYQSASATTSRGGKEGRNQQQQQHKAVAEAEASFREDVESSSFSPVDFYRRRLAFLLLVHCRRFWVPAALYGASLYGIGTVNTLLGSGNAALTVAAAEGAAGAVGVASIFSTVAMPQILSAAAAVALVNRFVVAGTHSKWLKKARAAAKDASTASAAAGAVGKSSDATATNSSSAITRLPLYRQIAVVTGATGALGREVAANLQSLGAMVIVTHLPGTQPVFATAEDNANATRNDSNNSTNKKVNSALNAVITQTDAPANTIPMRSYPLDLADRNSVRAFCGLLANDRSHTNAPNPLAVPKIDILVMAAGIKEHRYVPTRHGTDRHVEVNFLGHFLLTENLLPLLRRSQYSGVDYEGKGAIRGEKGTNTLFKGLRGGRIVHISCTQHAAIGQKVSTRAIVNAYHEETPNSSSSSAFSGPSKYKEKFLQKGDESYIVGPMYAASKVGVIYHTMSLHERRYNGVDGAASFISPAGGTMPSTSSSSSSTSTSASRSSASSATAIPLRPYTAVCAVLPPFTSFLSRPKIEEEDLPAAVVEARLAAGLTQEGSLSTKAKSSANNDTISNSKSAKKDGDATTAASPWGLGTNSASSGVWGANTTPNVGTAQQTQQGVIPQIGSNSSAVSNESAVQSFPRGSLLSSLWRKSPQQAAETVLDVCLRPDVYSGGGMMRLIKPYIPSPGQIFEVLSATCSNLRMRQSLIGWAVQQTRGFTIDVPPHASSSRGSAGSSSSKVGSIPSSNTNTNNTNSTSSKKQF